MHRRSFIAGAVASAVAVFASRGLVAAADADGASSAINKSAEEWRELLGAAGQRTRVRNSSLAVLDAKGFHTRERCF